MTEYILIMKYLVYNAVSNKYRLQIIFRQEKFTTKK
jgi:hypothetical protein